MADASSIGSAVQQKALVASDLGAFPGVCFLSLFFAFAIMVTLPGVREPSRVLTTTKLPEVELLGHSVIKPLQLRIWDRLRTTSITDPTPVRFDFLNTAVLQRGKCYDDILLPLPSLRTRAFYRTLTLFRVSPWLPTLFYRTASAVHRSNPVCMASKPLLSSRPFNRETQKQSYHESHNKCQNTVSCSTQESQSQFS